MLVIIYLLEDEQELSLGMLIRPKCIYNFCLLHACFVCLCYDFDTLSYTFDRIWTNLLTQCTKVPVSVFCCFCISDFPAIKCAPKNPEKSNKKQRNGSFRNHQGSGGGPPPGDQEGPWRGPTLGRARRPPGAAQGGAAPGTLLVSWWWPSSAPLVISEASVALIFYIFSRNFWSTFNGRKT